MKKEIAFSKNKNTRRRNMTDVQVIPSRMPGQDARRFLGSDVDSDEEVLRTPMGDFIVEDDGDEVAEAELQKMIRARKRKKSVDVLRNPPTKKQKEFLKRLCDTHGKRMPDMDTISKSRISILISILIKKQFDQWEYGDCEPKAVKPSGRQMAYLHQLCEELSLEYPENVDKKKEYDLLQFDKDLKLLRDLKWKRKTLTPSTWPYGASASIRLTKKFDEGNRLKITVDQLLEYMKNYGSGRPVKLMPMIFVCCQKAYNMSDDSYDAMNNFANGGNIKEIRKNVEKKIAAYDDYRNNHKVTRIPSKILKEKDGRKKLAMLYSFWSEQRKDMAPFDNDTVNELKKKSLFQWKSSHFCSAWVTSNQRFQTYTDAYIIERLKAKFTGLNDDDIRLGLAKCRRFLIVSNGDPSGLTNITWLL